MKPEDVQKLIDGLSCPPPVPGKEAQADELKFRAWEDSWQAFYDRMAELRRQLNQAAMDDDDAPAWARYAAYWAWQGAIGDSLRFRRSIEDSRRVR